MAKQGPKTNKFAPVIRAAIERGLDHAGGEWLNNDEILQHVSDDIGRGLGKQEKAMAVDAYRRVEEHWDNLDALRGERASRLFDQGLDPGPRNFQKALTRIELGVLKDHGVETKIPQELKPEATIKDESGALQNWLDFGGGTTKGKGRAIIEGSDPRNEDVQPEHVGFDPETGAAILKPGRQVGKPEIVTGHTGEPGDTSLIHASGHPDTWDEYEGSKGTTVEDMLRMLEDHYGTKGAISNFTDASKLLRRGPLINVPLGERPRGPLINVPLGQLPRSPLINAALGQLPSSPAINVPLGQLPRGPLINTPLPGLGGPGGILINKPAAGMSLQDILALKARTQAQAGGHPIVRQKVA